MHVGALEKLIVRGRFRVWLMVTIRWMEMRVGAVERLIVLEMLIVRGRLPRLSVLLVGMWQLERAGVCGAGTEVCLGVTVVGTMGRWCSMQSTRVTLA